ncbi:MAG: hypothetical protein Q9167_007566 [Letrouitia subvulpina]
MAPKLASHVVRRLEKESKYVYTESWARTVSAIEEDDTTPARSSPPDLAISQLYGLCLQAFRLTCCANDPSNSSLRRGISKSSMRDELARFNLWGDEIEMDVIDRALGPADFLTERALLHLLHIGCLLLKGNAPQNLSIGPHYHPALSYLCHTSQSALTGAIGTIGARNNKSIAPLRKIIEEKFKSESLTGEAGRDISEDEDSKDDLAGIPEDIGFRTRCLLELTPTIQDCIDRAEQSRLPAIEEFTVSSPAYYYVQIVQEKFKEAPVQLVQRLGEANWQRHNRLRRLASGDKEFNDATTVAEPKSLFHDSGIGTTKADGISYATSVKSHSSFISSNVTGERNSLRVPSAPAEVKTGQPFSCSLCGYMQYKIKNRVDWK